MYPMKFLLESETGERYDVNVPERINLHKKVL
jgi:hypothetical protein